MNDNRSPDIKRSKPFHISENCTNCDEKLILEDQWLAEKMSADFSAVGEDTIWYDEWTCNNKNCIKYGDLVFDWTKEKLTEFEDCMSEENMKKAEEW